MILTFTDNPKLKVTTVALAKFKAFEAFDRALRSGFDNATSISVAEGYILAALELNRFELATDMLSDLNEILSTKLEIAS